MITTIALLQPLGRLLMERSLSLGLTIWNGQGTLAIAIFMLVWFTLVLMQYCCLYRARSHSFHLKGRGTALPALTTRFGEIKNII